MSMDPQAPAPADAPAQEQAPAEAAQPEVMDPESEAVAAAAVVALFQMMPDCVALNAKQADDGSVSLSCEMSDGAKTDYTISASEIDAAIAETASED
jgi:hypothetical protein